MIPRRAVVLLGKALCLPVDAHELPASDGLFPDQIVCDAVHHIQVLGEDLLCLLVTVLQDSAHLLVHSGRGGIRAVEGSPAVQVLALHGGKAHDAEALAHSVLGDHGLCDAGRPLNIVGGTGRDAPELQLLRGTTAEKAHDHVVELFLGVQVVLLLRDLHDIAERAHRAGHDCDLLHGLRVLLHRADQRVADLVVGDDAPLLGAHDAVLLLLAHEDLLDGLEEVLLGDKLPVVLDRVDGGLVDHVCKVRADGTGGCKGDLVEVHGLVHLDILCVHLQDGDSAL